MKPAPQILLVDDNLDTLHVMARLLRMNGHQVITADSLGAALSQEAHEVVVATLRQPLPDAAERALDGFLFGRASGAVGIAPDLEGTRRRQGGRG